MNPHKIIPKILMIASWLTMTSMAYAAKYSYDGLNRLTQVAYDSGQLVSYRYDAGGNMLAVENKAAIELTLTPEEITVPINCLGSQRFCFC